MYTLDQCMNSSVLEYSCTHRQFWMELNDDYVDQTFTSNEKSKSPYTLVQCRIRWYCSMYRVSHKMYCQIYVKPKTS